MQRRAFLQGGASIAALSAGPARAAGPSGRVRPGSPGWPSAADWSALSETVGGRLERIEPPLAACTGAGDEPACAALFRELKNPYFINASPALTQTSGWADAWTSTPSVYAVAARDANDVAAAVDFARTHNLRLVVKGGGHSYQGTSNAADSLLIWTHPMDAVALHDAFVADGCTGAPQQAVTVGAGAIWMHVYDAVTTQGGRYVQGGGCVTVGVAGLVQSGGFGSFSKRYGTAAAGLLQAEIVTADGAIRTVNACRDPELFWGIKGGGGGSLGVVTKLVLRTHDLPSFLGAVYLTVDALTDAAFRRLVDRFSGFYAESLHNPHWGESVGFGRGNTLDVTMVFQDLDQAQAQAVWRPFLDWVAASPEDLKLTGPPRIIAAPARHFWDAAFLQKYAPSAVIADDRPGAPAGNVFWAGNLGETGWFLHGYESAWLPDTLLSGAGRDRLVDALFAASRTWRVSLHFNKGLSGAPDEAIAAARDTATNPAVIDAFALAISGAGGSPAFPGMPGHEPDLAAARRDAAAIRTTMDALRAIAPGAGSYVSESDYFLRNWQDSFWGTNYQRLTLVKRRYDPDGLFFVHHGVGSEAWSADGFDRA